MRVNPVAQAEQESSFRRAIIIPPEVDKYRDPAPVAQQQSDGMSLFDFVDPAVNAARGIGSGVLEGVANTAAGLGTFIQAPAANTLSGVMGARALADRGLSWVSEKFGGDGTLDQDAQDEARYAAEYAARQRSDNVRGAGPMDISLGRNIARIGEQMQDAGRTASQALNEYDKNYNPDMVAQEKKVQDAHGFMDTTKELLTNPLAFTHTLARSVPDMAAGMGIGRAVALAKLGTAGAKAEAAASMAARQVAAEGGDAAAQKLAADAASKAAVESVQKSATHLAGSAGVVSEAGSSAYGAREGTYQQVMNLPEAKISASLRYQELVNQTGSKDKARAMLANEIADQTPMLTGLGTAGGSMAITKIVGKDTTAELLANARKTTGKDIAVNTLQEGGEEVLQGVPQDITQHGAMVQADPTHKLDIGGGIAQNFWAGAAMGAGGTSASYVKDKYSKEQNPVDPNIAKLRDAGETAAADMLQAKEDKRNASEAAINELASMSDHTGVANDAKFQNDYHQLRTEGLKPVEAAGRASLNAGFSAIASNAGMSEKAIKAALEKATSLDIDKLPGFFQRYMTAFSASGAIAPVESNVADLLTEHRDQTMDAAIKTAYPETPDSAVPADDVLGAVEPDAPLRQDIEQAAHEAATSPTNDLPEPTQAQKEAGNYKVGRVKLHGLDISIENPRGSERSGTSPDGTTWKNQLAAHYGYVRGTEGNDGDHVDTFIGPNPDSEKVFVVDQVNEDGSFDEHKVLLGADSLQQADDLYHANYHAGWTGRGAITEMPLDQFKQWVKDGPKTEPVGQLPKPQQAPVPAGVSASEEPIQPTETSNAQAPEAQQAESQQAQETVTPEIVHYGKNGVPLHEGGKGFKTRKEAGDARKLQPHMRVVTVKGKHYLTEKTPAQLAAEEKAAKRLRNAGASESNAPIPAHAFIADAGGLSKDAMSDAGFDRNVKIRTKWLFGAPGKGMSIEQATERLKEAGYLKQNDGHKEALDLIRKSLANPQYTAEGWDRLAQAEQETQYADHLAAQQDAAQDEDFDPFQSSGVAVEDAADTDYHSADKDLQTEVDALLAHADANGIDTDAIKYDAANETVTGTQDDYLKSVKRRIQEADGNVAIANGSEERGEAAIPSGSQDSSPDTGEQTQSPGSQGEVKSQAEPTKTPSPEGVSTSEATTELRPSGNLVIKGDQQEILQKLQSAGITSARPMAGGVMVGKTDAQKASGIFAKSAEPTSQEQATEEKPTALIELRKRESVLKALRKCLES